MHILYDEKTYKIAIIEKKIHIYLLAVFQWNCKKFQVSIKREIIHDFYKSGF